MEISAESPPGQRFGLGMAVYDISVYVWGGSVEDYSLYRLEYGESAWVAMNTTGTPPELRKYFPYFLYGDYFYVLPGDYFTIDGFSGGCYRINLTELVWENLNCDLYQIAFGFSLYANYIVLHGGISVELGETNLMLISEIGEYLDFVEISPHWDYPKPRLGHSLHTSGESLWLFGGYSEGI